jgi:DNA mismatch repair protein MutL
MPDIIKLLPDSVANQIAAGEVIQRPASVIKELVENAVDAGATEINIVIRDAGRTLIQVIDNGKGMSPTDARLAFERHATSKIQRPEDLFSLHTMGFRGEALPSICAISQVELRTATDSNEVGTRVVINGSKVEMQEPCVCPKGSNFSIKNIFYNVPARRRFLKSDTSELSAIVREFERLALVNNDIRFTLDTGAKIRDFRSTNFRQRIADLWKNNLNPQLLPINIDTAIVKIEGFVSRPEHARRRNPLQYLIANGRNMRHPYFHRAIMSCYERLIAPDTQPCYFIKFEVDPSTIDVNIHPTKNEIKFENEQQIWSLLSSSVKAALGKYAAVPSIDFEADAIPIATPMAGDMVKAPISTRNPNYNPFDSPVPSQKSFMPEYRTKHTEKDWNKLYADFMNQAPVESLPLQNSLPLNDEVDSSSELPPICLQLNNEYIIATSRNGLLIIDQYRAHQKILYEQFMSQITKQERPLQTMMFSEEIPLDDHQQIVLEAMLPQLERFGFRIKNESHGKYSITAMPSGLSVHDGKDVILRMLDSADEESDIYGSEDYDDDFMLKRIAMDMAHAGAVPHGQRLTSAEMEKIVSELFRLPDPSHSIGGKLIVHTLSLESIKNVFS